MIYRNVLPRLWYLMIIKDSFRNKDGNYYSFGGTTKKQLGLILDKIRGMPDDAPQKLHKDICSYCGVHSIFTAKGDHIVNSGIHKKYPELDNLVFRVNSCRSCNSSKQDKDLLDWWVNYKGRLITDLTKDHLNIYCRAMWKYCKLTDRLDEEVPKEYETAIKQIRDHISEPSYDRIWIETSP